MTESPAQPGRLGDLGALAIAESGSGNLVENSPKISVVIPAFNAERFLDNTLASVTAQTFEPTEIIVVDDGSTDGTARIIKQWADRDSRVRHVRTENRGVASARNLGLLTARANFVAFVDADDLWHPAKLCMQYKMLSSASSEWGGCYALYRSIDTEGRILRDMPVLPCNGYIYARHLLCHLVGNGSSLLVRRDAALAVGGFDPSYAAEGIGGCEDLDFELRLAARYKIASVPLFLIGYRRYEGNMSSDRHRMVKGMTRTIEKNLENGPGVPKMVRRGALIAVLEYALTAYIVRRDFARAVGTLVLLFLNNPPSAFRVLSWLPRTVLKLFTRHFVASSATSAPESSRYFAELEPNEGVDRCPPPYLEKRTKAAKVIDEAIWTRLRCDPDYDQGRIAVSRLLFSPT